jgi:hypothetical protein
LFFERGPFGQVSLTGPHLLKAGPKRAGSGHMLIKAPVDAPVVIDTMKEMKSNAAS